MSQDEVKVDSRSKILEAAVDEFIEYGFSGARVDRIAVRAGINKAMIYYYFSSKEKLYQAVIDEHINRLGEEVQLKIEEAADLEESLLAISRIYMKIMTQNARYLPILLREFASGGGRLVSSLRRMTSERGLPERFLRKLEEGQKAGRFRDCDTRQALISFIGMNMFYLLFAPMANSIWGVEDENAFREQRPREVVELFMRGIERKDYHAG
ncbi:MAG: TetR/AcrR family transcriptional regulator [candidate division Zixibacteria bacterium]|nr:TetR/AcrR family transcriptional regulator [candidate division Zixibacteria bacterium]